MVRLVEQDIQTQEVLAWQGVHIFHALVSSCSQKLRIFLNLKKIGWQSHPIDLQKKENLTPYYLGINPRGLVPVLIHDGAVHIESNDILRYLEDCFPSPSLVPKDKRAEMERLLRFEDELHFDLRALSFRFLFMPDAPPKTATDLERYASTGSGTVQGRPDVNRGREIAFWTAYANGGISDEVARSAARRFHDAFKEIEARIENRRFILGDAISLIDIAWIVYAERLRLCGYPLERMHPRLSDWHAHLMSYPEIAPELTLPPGLASAVAARHASAAQRLATLDAVCFGVREGMSEQLQRDRAGGR